MEKTKLEDLKERIKKKFELTGFPTEEQTSLALQKAGWSVIRNVRYLDKDERTHKEIDITAIKDFKRKEFYFKLILVIECKKQENLPWVFFQGTSKIEDPMTINLVCRSTVLDSTFKYLEKRFKEHYYFGRDGYTFSISPYSIFDEKIPGKDERKGTGEFPIGFAINQTIDNLSETYSRELDLVEKATPTIILIYPIIVLNGDLVSYSASGELKIEEHLSYLANLTSKEALSVAGKLWRFKPIVIDFVTLSYLENFLRLLEEKGVIY